VTTPLVKPLAREILVGQTAYRVTLMTDRIAITQKGHRMGFEMTWDELLVSRKSQESAAPTVSHAASLPRSIATEIARDVQLAIESLGRAGATLTQAGALPPALLAQMNSDPTYGRAEQRDDWFVEPLLTIAEVASVLRLSTRAVRRLQLRSITVGGEVRYRQSELREYLRKQESVNPRWGRTR
jgi:hypothetical protein